MKKTLNREALLSQLDVIAPGLSPKDMCEQSSCFIVKDGMMITYNDEVACQIKTEFPFEGAIAAQPLIDCLRKMKEDTISLSIKDGHLVVGVKGKEIGIAMEEEILLAIESVEQPTKWKSLPDEFGDAVDMVYECAGKDAQEFALTCMHMTSTHIETCDNFQLARFRLDMQLQEPVLVLSTSMKHIVSLGMTKFSITDSWMHFKNTKGMVVSCRRYEEEYDDYDEFAEQQGAPIQLPKALADAADLAEVFSSQNADSNQVMVILRPGKIAITSKSAKGFSKQVKKVKYDGEPLAFMISPKLLRTIVSQHSDCEVNGRVLKVNGGRYTYVTSLGDVGA